MTEKEYIEQRAWLVFELGNCQIKGDHIKIAAIITNLARLELVRAATVANYEPIPYD